MDKSIKLNVLVNDIPYKTSFRICYIDGMPTAFSVAGNTLPRDTIQLGEDIDFLDPDERNAVEEAMDVVWEEIRQTKQHKKKLARIKKV